MNPRPTLDMLFVQKVHHQISVVHPAYELFYTVNMGLMASHASLSILVTKSKYKVRISWHWTHSNAFQILTKKVVFKMKLHCCSENHCDKKMSKVCLYLKSDLW